MYPRLLCPKPKSLVRSLRSGHGHLNPLCQTETLSSRRSSVKVHRSLVKSGEKLGMFIAIKGGCWVYFALHHRLLPPSECIPLHKCLPLNDYITFQPIVAHPGCSPCWSLRCLPQTIHTKKASSWPRGTDDRVLGPGVLMTEF